MRLLALLAALSLALRWADAPCGCVEHNGWLALADEDHADHAHGHHDEPAVGHDCGGTGRPSFTGSTRVEPAGTATPVALAASVDLPAADPSDADDLSPTPTPPLRAALKVYRV